MKVAVAVLLISATIHSLCFAKWPGNPDWDVHHSVFAAENMIAHKGLRSINLYPQADNDLAHHARLVWMTYWPPIHSLLYAAIIVFGLSVGAATKLLALLYVLIGGLGWVYLARELGGSKHCIIALALAYPWLSFITRVYADFKNDHLSCALMAWVCLAMMKIEPLRETGEKWGRLIFAALLAGSTVLVKYSLAPVIAASALYLFWLDGSVFTPERRSRLLVFFGVLLLPGVFLWSLNRAWGEHTGTYALQTGGGLSLSLPMFAHLFSNTFGTVVGWDLILTQLNTMLERLWGIHLLKGSLLLGSAVFVIVWFANFSRRTWNLKERAFVVYLGLLTASLWVMLIVMTVVSGIKYEFSSDTRFYMPIALGWLVLGAVSLGKMAPRDVIRSAAFYTLSIPVAYTVVFFAATGLSHCPYPIMPNSKAAWIKSKQASHADFLSNFAKAKFRKPDLLVAPSAEFMTELSVPCFFNFRAVRDDHHVYFSSTDLEVWAMVDPADERVLLQKFSRAMRSERVSVPNGFPYVVYIFDFAAT